VDDERLLVKLLTPLERRHPPFVAGVRFVGGVVPRAIRVTTKSIKAS
jgi:hypothetical protein